MVRLLCVLIGYFMGMISCSYIVGKIHGVDIRKHGSGNLGATNTMRALGKKAGFLVMFLDFAKVVIAVIIVRFLFPESYANEKFLVQTYTLLGCILGHDFPFYLKFKGGKGCACISGFAIFFYPFTAMILASLFAILLIITKYISLGTMFLYVSFTAVIIFWGQTGRLDLEPTQLMEVYAIYIFLIVITVIRHRTNIKRIIDGNENKTYLIKKMKKNDK